MTGKFVAAISSACLFAVFPARGQSQLQTALASLRTDASAENSVLAELRLALSRSDGPVARSQKVNDPFCEALRGLPCSRLQQLEGGLLPVQVFTSKDGKLLCISADTLVAGKLKTLIFTFQQKGNTYANPRVQVVLDEAYARAEQLPSTAPEEIKILAYGGEERANRSPISITVVDVSATKTTVMLKRQHLLEGEVTHQGTNVTVQYTSLEPSLQTGFHSPRVADSYAVGTKTAVQMLHAKPVH